MALGQIQPATCVSCEQRMVLHFEMIEKIK